MSTGIKSDGWREVDAVVVGVGDRVTLESGNRLTRFVVDYEFDGSLYDGDGDRYDLTGQQPDWRIVRIEQPAKPDATPAPLDPSKVKAGDTVAVRHLGAPNTPMRPFEATGEVYDWGGLHVAGLDMSDPYVTLTAHQPAPEPEPEYEVGVTVADIQVGHSVGSEPMRATRRDGGWRTKHGNWDDRNVLTVRPLVVIDPVAARKALEDNGWGANAVTEILHELGIEAS